MIIVRIVRWIVRRNGFPLYHWGHSDSSVPAELQKYYDQLDQTPNADDRWNITVATFWDNSYRLAKLEEQISKMKSTPQIR